MLSQKHSTSSWENTVSMLLLVKKLFNFIVGYCTDKNNGQGCKRRREKGYLNGVLKFRPNIRENTFYFRKKNKSKPTSKSKSNKEVLVENKHHCLSPSPHVSRPLPPPKKKEIYLLRTTKEDNSFRKPISVWMPK